MRVIFSIVLLFLFISSCKKESAGKATGSHIYYDTIKPLPYFPAFPGSFWNYYSKQQSGPDAIITATVAPEYMLASVHNNIAMVPFYNGAAIFGYKRVINAFAAFTSATFNVFLSENVGDVYNEVYPSESHYGNYSKTERMKLVSQHLNGTGINVLVVKGSFIAPMGIRYKDSCWVSYREYTKDIGLTFHSVVDTITGDTISRLRLASYRIGK